MLSIFCGNWPALLLLGIPRRPSPGMSLLAGFSGWRSSWPVSPFRPLGWPLELGGAPPLPCLESARRQGDPRGSAMAEAVLRRTSSPGAAGLERFVLLCGHGRVEPYEPHRVCLVEFGDSFS